MPATPRTQEEIDTDLRCPGQITLNVFKYKSPNI